MQCYMTTSHLDLHLHMCNATHRLTSTHMQWHITSTHMQCVMLHIWNASYIYTYAMAYNKQPPCSCKAGVSHTWMRHVTRIDASWYTYGCAMPQVYRVEVVMWCSDEVMTLISRRRGTNMDESWLTCEFAPLPHTHDSCIFVQWLLHISDMTHL